MRLFRVRQSPNMLGTSIAGWLGAMLPSLVFRVGRGRRGQKEVHFSKNLDERMRSSLAYSAVARVASSKYCTCLIRSACRRTLVTTESNKMAEILQAVQDHRLSVSEAQSRITAAANDDPMEAFANLDLKRSRRAGFPEAVFAQGKTPLQVAKILDRMAEAQQSEDVRTPILATRVTKSMYSEMKTYDFQHGTISFYGDEMGLVQMKLPNDETIQQQQQQQSDRRIVVVTAGTTDIPVAEEAAVTLEVSGFPVDRVFDAGVAGLHRILKAIPTLTDPKVGCIIVVAGMDGALPSVVGGLVSVPVIAVPTSIGYGASFGGVSALLTMLNSCSPGVAVVNIDNGFGAAAMAVKCLR